MSYFHNKGISLFTIKGQGVEDTPTRTGWDGGYGLMRDKEVGVLFLYLRTRFYPFLESCQKYFPLMFS